MVLRTGVIILPQTRWVLSLQSNQWEREAGHPICTQMCNCDSNKARKGESTLWGSNVAKKVRDGFAEEVTLS